MVKAIIENGIVTNRIVHEGGELTLTEGQMYINEGDQGVEMGWHYDYVTGLFSSAAGETIAQRVGSLEGTTSDAQLVSSITFAVLAQTGQIDDVTIAEHAAVFAEWDEHWTGKRGTILTDAGALYRALHDVGVGQNTKPSTNDGSLWQKIGNPNDEWPEWAPYFGVGDAYRMGDKVTHNGKRWECTAVGGDGIWNVWEPGVYGWTEVAG